MNKIIVIVGPTGVGKTKLSIALAHYFKADIINADSMQVYKELNIGTAKITEEEKENITHHLLDIKDVREEYSVYDYQKDGRALLDNLNKNVIIVGGTGLYIKALLYDYEFNQDGQKYDFTHLSNQEIYNELKEDDPSIDIHINNRRRLERRLTLKLNDSISSNKGDNLLYDAIFIGLTTDRTKLYAQIDKSQRHFEPGFGQHCSSDFWQRYKISH